MCSALMYAIPIGVIQAYSERHTNVMAERREVKTRHTGPSDLKSRVGCRGLDG